MLFFIIKCIKINCFLLDIEIIENYSQSIVNFISKLELKTKLLVILGSFFFYLFYYSLFLFIQKEIKILIINNVPLINKIFHFYRKIILLKYYDN